MHTAHTERLTTIIDGLNEVLTGGSACSAILSHNMPKNWETAPLELVSTSPSDETD
jgi:hypothetical protein